MFVEPECSIVILSFNQMEYTEKCLDSIREYTEDVRYEIIVVDNNSNTETVDYLKRQKDIILVCNSENKGFAGGCNQGIEKSKGKYIVLLNNDTIVTHKWLSNMLTVFKNDNEVSLVGPLTNNTVGKQMIKISYADDVDEMQKFAYQIAETTTKPWRTLRLVAFCVVIKKEVFDEIGYFDTDFLIGNYEDDDFNIRCILAGKKMCICRNSFIHHFMNISFKNNNLSREKIMFENKLKLENKWNKIDWNYYAAFNSDMLKRIISKDAARVLHLGCGVGAMEIELKDNNPDCFIVCIEENEMRRKIASHFVDVLYKNFFDLESSIDIKEADFDIIIVESSIERYGIEIIKKLKSYLGKGGLLIVRIFNFKHISSIEKIVYGSVEGNLICSVSEDFRFFYMLDIEHEFSKMNLKVINKNNIVKKLSSRQEKLLNLFQEVNNDNFINEARIYNTIYELVEE